MTKQDKVYKTCSEECEHFDSGIKAELKICNVCRWNKSYGDMYRTKSTNKQTNDSNDSELSNLMDNNATKWATRTVLNEYYAKILYYNLLSMDKDDKGMLVELEHLYTTLIKNGYRIERCPNCNSICIPDDIFKTEWICPKCDLYDFPDILESSQKNTQETL